MHCDVGAVLSSIEHTKYPKYSQAAETINASFTPFVVTADGALGLEAKTFIRHLADKIAAIWHKSNSEVLGYVRARMLFAVLRATNLCIRGSKGVSIPARMNFSTASRVSFVFSSFCSGLCVFRGLFTN